MYLNLLNWFKKWHKQIKLSGISFELQKKQEKKRNPVDKLCFCVRSVCVC